MHPSRNDETGPLCRLFAVATSAEQAPGHGIWASGATGLPCPMIEIAWT
jgi:hypothetical protein